MIFPAWFKKEEGEPPILFATELSVPKGWIHVPGRYDVQTGQWIDADPLDHDDDGKKGGSKPASPPSLFGKSKEALRAIAEAEGVKIADDAKARDIQAAIKAKRAG